MHVSLRRTISAPMSCLSFAAALLFLTNEARAADERPIGIATLRTDSLSRPVAAMVNEQLRTTLEALSRRRVVSVTLPANAAADDVEALRAAGEFGDLHAVVSGSVSAVETPGTVTLLWVPSGNEPPRSITRPVPGNAEPSQRAAIDAAACALIDADGDTASCQVPVELRGSDASSELDLNGERILRVGDLAAATIDVGSHVARGCQGDDCSTSRRLDLVRNTSLVLRVERECNRMHLLGPAEEPDCGGMATSEIIPLVIEAEPTNWKGIVAVAIGGAAVVAGTIFALQASAAKGRLEEAKGSLSEDAMLANMSSLQTNRRLATASFIVGGVAGATGGVMLAFDF